MNQREKELFAYGVQDKDYFAMESHLEQVSFNDRASAHDERSRLEYLRHKAEQDDLREIETIEDDLATDVARAAEKRDAAHYHAIVAGFSFAANIACTAAKLFPTGYDGCQTWQCRQMVHNALLTLAAGAVDMIERSAYNYVLVPDTSKFLGCIPLGGLSRMVQKLAQLLVNLAWNVSDVLAGIAAAPGTGTLVLSYFACAVQVLLTLIDLRTVCLIQRLNYERDAGEEPEPYNLRATIGFQLVAARQDAVANGA